MLLYLTGYYTQYALRPVLDSKINDGIHFIKIPFINKGMDFTDLPCTLRDKSVQSALSNYFKNCEVPIICYIYNKPIRGAIFNFTTVFSDLDISTCTPVWQRSVLLPTSFVSLHKCNLSVIETQEYITISPSIFYTITIIPLTC